MGQLPIKMSLYLFLQAWVEKFSIVNEWLNGVLYRRRQKYALVCITMAYIDVWITTCRSWNLSQESEISRWGCCPHYEALHGKFLHNTKTAMFPFILLVITVKQVCLFFSFVDLRQAISVLLCLPPLMIALDVFKQQLCSKWRQPCL